jgi:sulfur-carrier protein
MQVIVRLYATLAHRVAEPIRAQQPEGIGPGTPITLDLPEGSTLADLAVHLALSQDQVKLIFVNGRSRELEDRLQPGDEVGLFPPIGGG